MVEAAGLVLGVLALWQNCIEVFGVIDSVRRYGVDYEVLCVEFEVERMRLLCWGDAVGLSSSQDPRPTPDKRLLSRRGPGRGGASAGLHSASV